MEKQKAISGIIENFDFEKVHKVMEFLEWGWQDDGVPTIGKLMLSAQKRLEEAFDYCNSNKTNYYTGSGGFHIKADYDKKEGCTYLELSFQLANWDYYEER